VKELASAFTLVRGFARACRCCRFGRSLLPSGRSPLWGQCVERQPLVGALSARGTGRPQAVGRRPRLAPKPSGGDHASHRIEAHADLILATCEAQPRIFLRELRDRLGEHGVRTSTSSLSRFFARHGITWKKGRRTQPSRSART
jgi:hypothetical protein